MRQPTLYYSEATLEEKQTQEDEENDPIVEH